MSLIVHLPDFELHECESLEQAAALLAQHGPAARVLAGGTDLLVDLKTGRTRAEHLVSVRRLSVLRGITLESGDGAAGARGYLRVGAATTIEELDASPLVRRHFPPLREATREMATVQVRNLATVGGNLASAVPCADLPPILIVLGAAVELWSAGATRIVALERFFVAPRQTAMRPGELLLAVRVPLLRRGFGAAYARFALRGGNAIAVASVAAGLALDADDAIASACIVLGAVGPTPVVAAPAAAALIGQAAEDGALERAAAAARRCALPISDIRGSAEYRRELVEVLARRALVAAAQRAGESRL